VRRSAAGDNFRSETEKVQWSAPVTRISRGCDDRAPRQWPHRTALLPWSRVTYAWPRHSRN